MQNSAQKSAVLTASLLAILLILRPPHAIAQATVTLVATGSSLPAPLYVQWADEYHKAHSETQLRYLTASTAESAHRILAGNGDFGGGDAPIPEKQLKDSAHPVLELPTIVIGIAIVYNLPGAPGEVRLSGPVLAEIYLGKIASWNDPQMVKLNPDLKLPNLPISVLHLTEGKGSSYIFSDFLSKVSPEFQAKVGKSVSPKWPVGASFGRPQDMLEHARKTPGAIAYTGFNWATKSGLGIASIKNAAGEFVRPTVKSIAHAASAFDGKMTDDFRISIVNAPSKESYPISSFTWLYVPEHAPDPVRGRAVGDFLKWVYIDGQRIAEQQGYTPLPDGVRAKVVAKAATIR
jgi:phosphate transport system substrate-binding protein